MVRWVTTLQVWSSGRAISSGCTTAASNSFCGSKADDDAAASVAAASTVARSASNAAQRAVTASATSSARTAVKRGRPTASSSALLAAALLLAARRLDRAARSRPGCRRDMKTCVCMCECVNVDVDVRESEFVAVCARKMLCGSDDDEKVRSSRLQRQFFEILFDTHPFFYLICALHWVWQCVLQRSPRSAADYSKKYVWFPKLTGAVAKGCYADLPQHQAREPSASDTGAVAVRGCA